MKYLFYLYQTFLLIQLYTSAFFKKIFNSQFSLHSYALRRRKTKSAASKFQKHPLECLREQSEN